jgi:CDP-glucose 4,6-dehydratase
MSFWRGRRVLLTGHTGFKGGWLALWLQKLGAEVTGYSLVPPTEPNLFTLAEVARGMASVIGDVGDLAALKQTIQSARPEVILHLAAQPLVHGGYSDPVETYRTNVMGTVHLLEAARSAPGLRSIVNVTTDKCYENREWPWGYREVDRLGGYDPYSNSKACSELVTAAFRNAFFNPADHASHRVAVASARAGNVIGGGDWGKDRLVPDIFRAIERGQPVHIRRPLAIRPWQHVLEPLSGYLRLAQSLYEDGPRHSGGWNFGPEDTDARNVQWMVETLAGLWGPGTSWNLDEAQYPHEAHFLKLDCAKAKTELGWRPGLNLPTALDWTVQWHRNRISGNNIRGLCEDQINNYEKLIAS